MPDTSFQLPGVSTGIDWGAMIDKIIEKEKKPATLLQNQVDTLTLKKSLYEEMSSAFFKVRNTLTSLRLESTYLKKQAEMTVLSGGGKEASAILKATPNTNAEIAQWNIEVLQTAKAQRYMSNRISTPGEALNLSGTFRIQVGQQFTSIKVENSDTIRTINQKIGAARDQYGQPMLATAKLVDNRLVIESAHTGLDTNSGKKGDKITMSASNLMYLPMIENVTDADGKVVSEMPKQIVSIKQGVNNYVAGKDFTYDSSTGLITWLNNTDSARPAEGTELELVYTASLKLTRELGDDTIALPNMPSEMRYASPDQITLRKANGTPFTDAELDEMGPFELVDDADGGQSIHFTDASKAAKRDELLREEFTITVGNAAHYNTHYNKAYIFDEATDDGNGNMVQGTVARDLGLFDAGNVVTAQDAKLLLNDVPVTRASNTIEDLIANVKLELVGAGSVSMNITQDAKGAIEGVQAFVDAYNELMTWINERSSEKQDATKDNNQDGVIDERDTLFGLLHGDSLLWSIKNQLRMLQMTPIAVAPNAIMSKAFVNPNENLAISGSFYISTGGMRSRVDVAATDSLEDIRRKIEDATDMTAVNGSKGGVASKKAMPITVSINEKGQLVIDSKSVKMGTQTKTENVLRGSDGYVDFLPFTYDEASPIDGKLVLTSGSKVFQRGIDYDIVTEEVKGVMQSKIVWNANSHNLPKANALVTANYAYNEAAVSVTEITGTGDLSALNFHADKSTAALFSVGIQSEGHSTTGDFGKSGLLDFNTDKMMDALTKNPKATAAMMVSFMKQMDSFVGNMVDSGGMLVGGEIVTKGRVAGATESLTTQISGLNKRIADIERRLEEKQTSLYKRFTDMELAITKMNAQMASMSKYFANMQGGKAAG